MRRVKRLLREDVDRRAKPARMQQLCQRIEIDKMGAAHKNQCRVRPDTFQQSTVQQGAILV